MKIVVYTAVCGDRDRPRSDVMSVTYDRFRSPRRNARTCKLLSHLFVDADVSIWIDGNVRLEVSPERLVGMLGDKPVGLFRHSEQADIFEEAERVIERKQDDETVVREQISQYRALGYSERNLGMTFLLVRRHTDAVRRRNERWFSELSRYSLRDQISFPVVFDGLVNYWPASPVSGRTRWYSRLPHGAQIV